jgi:hypothetical protein
MEFLMVVAFLVLALGISSAAMPFVVASQRRNRLRANLRKNRSISQR